MRRRQPRTPPHYCSSRRALVRAIYGNGKPPIAWQKSWRGSNQSRLIRSQGAEKRSLQEVAWRRRTACNSSCSLSFSNAYCLMVSSSRYLVAAPTISVETSDLAQSLVTISRATDSAPGRWEAKATAPGPLGFVSFRLRLGHGAVLTVPSSLSWSTSHSQLRRGCPRFWIDLHGSRHASHQSDVIRHLIDMNAYRHTLRQPHPGEDRIHRSEPRLIRLRVRDIDASGDAPDMATNKLAVAHQLDTCPVAFNDPAEPGLL